MQKTITVTQNDYERLMALVEVSYLKSKASIAGRLYESLTTARLFPPDQIPSGIVTMNSRVFLKEVGTGRETEITLTYPQEAEPRERKVSVISEIGLALFGKREREIVSWKTPVGTGSFEIQAVTYQPEAAGHYHL